MLDLKSVEMSTEKNPAALTHADADLCECVRRDTDTPELQITTAVGCLLLCVCVCVGVRVCTTEESRRKGE